MNAKDWTHIEELFHDARELPPEARGAYLAEACVANPAWQAEVESLLAAHSSANLLGEFIPALAAEWVAQAHPLVGRTLGRYQIQSLLGEGGMGEVFLAQDTQLGRRAALKLLPERFTTDAARVRRFEQEARAVLALNHPNIVTLFDLGQADGAFFMATEYVEGETLRQRLRTQGALPAAEALELTLQIAAALTAAHAAGIIHRDIKPENVMIRRDGYVKVLDFGLAKVADPFVDDTDSADQSSLTDTGAVMGTARYMSPEQARGLRVDARTDVFSLGVVLYEMLAGRAPFNGQTRSDLLVEILTVPPPPLVETAPATPAALETILHKALAKEVAARYATMQELADALKVVADELAFSGRAARALPVVSASPTVAKEPSSDRAKLMRQLVLVLAGAVALVGAVSWYLVKRESRTFEAALLARLKFTPVTSWQTEPNSPLSVLSTSSDGKFLALSKSHAGQSDIYVQQLNGGQPRKVTDDVWEDDSPIWSPDGQQLAYLSQRNGKTELWVIPSFGGGGQLLKTFETVPRWLTSWSRDGRRLYYEVDAHLYTLEMATRETRCVTTFLSNKAGPNAFAVSLNDQWLAYVDRVGGVKQLFVVPLAGGVAVQITHEGEENDNPLWLPDGERLLYSSKRNGVRQICMAYRDARKPVQITFGHEDMVPWEITQDGHTIYYREERVEADIYTLDAVTKVERQTVSDIKPNYFPVVSPDGRTLLWQQASDTSQLLSSEIFANNLATGDQLRLAANGFDPRWSPRGGQIAFLRRQGAAYQLWTVRPDGAEAQMLVGELSVSPSLALQPLGWIHSTRYAWAPDGQRLVYSAVRGGISNLFVSPADSFNEAQVTQNADASLRLLNPLWSPNGRELIYVARNASSALPPYTIQLFDGEHTRTLWQADVQLRLLGWLPNSTSLLVGVTTTIPLLEPVTVELLELTLTGKRTPLLGPFAETYLPNVVLAPNGKQVAYVARQDNADNVWLVSLETGQRQKLTANTDANRNLGCLTWSSQANQLCYIKQSNTTSIRMIENFQ